MTVKPAGAEWVRRATRWTVALGLMVFVGAAVGCDTVPKKTVLHRPNCETCHQPLNEVGEPHGIADAHPAYALSCVTCHGGNDRICTGDQRFENGKLVCDGEWVYDKDQAHVSPGDGPKYIKNLSGEKLDQIDPAYVRFINPGDLRAMEETCGRCHEDQVEAVLRSTMAHTSGEVTVARYRAGKQAYPGAEVGAFAVTDPTFEEAGSCASAGVEMFNPPQVDVTSADPMFAPTVANAQDQYMVKSCFRCHLNDFGENRFPGDFRSSGCTACHMTYTDNALYEGDDPWISKQTIPHVAKHELTVAPDTNSCTHCHYRGGRLGIGYQGYRESAGGGNNPPAPGVLGRSLHGHDANYYLTDEDVTNNWDETPPDVHFEAGMDCIDCHGEIDVHGDGHIYADTQCAVSTKCEDCHGSVRQPAIIDEVQRPNLSKDADGYWLVTKREGKRLKVPQTSYSVTPGHPDFSAPAAQSMGVNAAGFSHTDKMECYTCHSSWLPSCYGCHVTVDMTRSKPYHTTGVDTPGRPTGKREWVVLNDLVLMWNTKGKLAPSMPAERLFMTLLQGGQDGTAEPLFESKPRTYNTDDGRTIAGFGQRTYNPHTIRKRSQFMACDRCHSEQRVEAPDNEVLMDLTHGFGTERFVKWGCDVSNAEPSCDPVTDQMGYRLDAIVDREGKSLVAVGHPDPQVSRPLTLDEINAMRAVVVQANEGLKTEVPPNATTDRWWPKAMFFDEQVYPETEE